MLSRTRSGRLGGLYTVHELWRGPLGESFEPAPRLLPVRRGYYMAITERVRVVAGAKDSLKSPQSRTRAEAQCSRPRSCPYSPECLEGKFSEVERVGEKEIFVGVSQCTYNVPKGSIGKDRSDVGGDGRRVGPHTRAA
jgi:hypothetical protein